MRHLILCFVLLPAPFVCAADSPRQEVSLNGAWEYQLVEDLTKPPSGGPWKPCRVPGYLSGTNYQRAWLRRSFAVPPAMRGQRIKLCFGGVKYNSRVVVNGREVGGCFGGYEPFELDVTGAVRFDGANELLVGCHDWTGVFTPGKVEFPADANWDVERGAPRDKILSPIGGLYSLYGIWDDVTLRAHPAVYVQDVFIQPSVRRKELVVQYTLANESPDEIEVELTAAVEDAGRDALQLPATKLKLPPLLPGHRSSATGHRPPITDHRPPITEYRPPITDYRPPPPTIILRRPWPDPPLWSHVDPQLLCLRTALSSGDQVRTRFGFREFWVEGHKFFLNGSRINLLATSWWPPHGLMTRDEIRQRWEAVKRMGCVAFRTHTQPWPRLHYELADEVGLLMIVEGAVWNDDDTYRIHDPVFWDNYAAHLRAMVARDKNRPSVIMWSLENEFFGGRMNDASQAKSDLIRMGRLVQQLDPTRPILYESDGDPGGVADVIGIHYPHEYPDFTCWPNEADWLQRPAQISHMFLNGEKEFAWRRDKPLYVGEFLWLPSRDPSWHTVFFGDESYIDYHRYRNLGKAESWKMQILGYRHKEVAGISPWTVIEGGPLDDSNPLWQAHQYAYQSVAAYPLDYDSRFYAGDEVLRRVDVFNDSLDPAELEFAWVLAAGDKVIERGLQSLRLAAGERQPLEVRLHLPPVERRTPLVWRLELRDGDQSVFQDRREFTVFPPSRFPSLQTTIGLFDPQGKTAAVLQSAGLRVTPVASLDSIPAAVDVLVIGDEALRAASPQVPVIGRIAPERAAIDEFLARGGRVLVLRQEAYPEGLFDVSLTNHRSTMTFPMRGDHPALRGIEPVELKFWRGDHLLSTDEVARPVGGSSVPIVVSGSAAGVDHAPLLERPAGRGCVVHSQMLLVDKFSTEPAAARILLNLTDYLATRQPENRKTGVVGGGAAYHATLRSLGWRFDDLTKRLDATDLSDYSLLVCSGQVPDLAQLRGWIESGGRLWLHRIPADALETASRELQLELGTQTYAGAVTRAEGDMPLLNAIAREDLYWLGQHRGIAWADTPRALEMADSVLTKTLDETKAVAYEVEDWTLDGQLVSPQSPGVVFATVGSASQEIDFPADGDWLIGIRARGTPCRGEFPAVAVSVDGQRFGTVSVTDRWRSHALLGRVRAGKHRVSIAFTNDASDPPREDRNLTVDRVLIARDENPRVQFLTSPAALAVAPLGQGLVLIDQLRWDTEERNARKAARYACGLATALGGDFQSRPGVTIECEQMTPQPGMPFFRNQGSFAALACNGYIERDIQVAAAGRYTLELLASGTPAADVFPLVAVAIDGQQVGQVQLTSGNWRPYSLDLALTAGAHQLRLSFTNDLNTAGEDRNLMLDKATFLAR